MPWPIEINETDSKFIISIYLTISINASSKVIHIGENYFNKISTLHQHFTNLYS